MKADFEFECDCKAKTLIKFNTPGLFETKLEKIICAGCQSEWQLKLRGRTDGIAASHRLIAGSRKLGDIILKRRMEKIANAPKKKAPQFFMPS